MCRRSQQNPHELIDRKVYYSAHNSCAFLTSTNNESVSTFYFLGVLDFTLYLPRVKATSALFHMLSTHNISTLETLSAHPNSFRGAEKEVSVVQWMEEPQGVLTF